tara:strand:- start:1467 stop:2303 length:837 start_codon:yes stop_codon:yes gene_type:complete
MLKSNSNKKYHFKTIFYGFATKKTIKLVNLSFLFLSLLFLIGWYFSENSNKILILNKLKTSNQLLINSGFRIENIIIAGTNNLPKDYINNIIKIYNDVNIFKINLSTIHNKIIKNSWVKEAYIERVLPNTLKIKILEKKPIAIWQNNKTNKLVTANGEVISHGNVNIFKNDFPIIKGNKSKENIYSILRILEANKSLFKNIWSLTFINQRRWDLHFNQGLVVRLPAQNVNEAWEKIIKLQQNYNILNLKLTEIDLRNPKQILGKINFDKRVIFKRKYL